MIVCWGGRTSAQITRDLLRWEPTSPDLITDLKEGRCFDEAFGLLMASHALEGGELRLT